MADDVGAECDAVTLDGTESVPRDLSIAEYVDDRDLERLTPLKRSYWQKLRQNTEGPAYRKIGRRRIYLWADVRAWLDRDQL